VRLNVAKVREYLRACQFRNLFIEELGWSHCTLSPITVSVDGEDYTLSAISEMGGLVALQCKPASNGRIPEYHIRRKIDRLVTKLHYEHIIIYCGGNQQVWQWVKKEPGRPSAPREHPFRYDQSGTPLIQKLDGLVFTLEELDGEGNVSIKAVSERVKSALDIDKVTKRFYDRFKVELEVFKGFIKGISNAAHTDWYASLMLNRLMFIYFVQKKGFLDNDSSYLRNRLRMVQEKRGQNRFYSFYRSFLRVLFHEGLNSRERTPELLELLGNVPYLNGGLFEEHELEQENPDLDIPDEAFERMFDFFDQYEWHLDIRPMRNDREINPDVLGYIFEKYINAIQPGEQKAKGAYYTKEDITGYISQNTIIPYLFDAARRKCAIAFEGEQSVWRLLQENPDAYIYPAVKLGVIDRQRNVLPESMLPDFVQRGMRDPKARMFDNRYNLTGADLRDEEGNRLTLPTETWREYVERRKRCLDLRSKLGAGEVKSIDDLITYNLDIRQFAQDVIENSEGPELLRAFYSASQSVTVLDPTCGSGAFLFAALNILEPLYEGCLERMQEFVSELDTSQEKQDPRKYSDFRRILEAVAQHPNQPYFIFKSIILNNLFGVDIMPEAVEICKLRLFLKLAAQVEPDRSKDNMGLEPLPDIDFNIRAGNTLVGFATYDEVKSAVMGSDQKRMDVFDEMSPIEEKAQEVERLWQRFREQQEMLDGGEITARDKQELRNELAPLEEELNRYLAKQYGDAARDYEGWLASHRPFHWFIEFHGIMSRGGFDVVLGNPPYVEFSKVVDDYSVKGYSTLECGNLYAFVVERICGLVRKILGRSGMIIPHSAICTDRMAPLQRVFREAADTLWVSSYDIRPAKLFDGVDQRLAIYMIKHGNGTDVTVIASRYHRWHGEFRPFIMGSLKYVDVSDMGFPNSIPKVDSLLETSLWTDLSAWPKLAMEFVGYRTPSVVYYHNAPRYWNRAMSFAPYFWNERNGELISTQVKSVYLQNGLDKEVVVACLNSSLFYWWFIILSDCRHLNLCEIESFPLGLEEMSSTTKDILATSATELMLDMKRHAKRKKCQYKSTGKVVYDEYYPKYSKALIDKIDRALAKHYGFTDEELDFIINYDIKYRMGLRGEDNEHEE